MWCLCVWEITELINVGWLLNCVVVVIVLLVLWFYMLLILLLIKVCFLFPFSFQMLWSAYLFFFFFFFPSKIIIIKSEIIFITCFLSNHFSWSILSLLFFKIPKNWFKTWLLTVIIENNWFVHIFTIFHFLVLRVYLLFFIKSVIVVMLMFFLMLSLFILLTMNMFWYWKGFSLFIKFNWAHYCIIINWLCSGRIVWWHCLYLTVYKENY